MPIEIIDILKAKNNGTFPIVDSDDVLGGHHSVNTMEEMINIPIIKQKIGMTCFVKETEEKYILLQNGWVKDKSKGGVHISETPPEGDDKHEVIWVDANGDRIQLPSDPSDPTLLAIQATLIDYQNRIASLELLTRKLIDGGGFTQSSENTILVDPNITRAEIKFKRGNSGELTVLQAGEPGFVLDKGDFYIGDGKGGVVHVNSAKNLTSDRLLLTANNDKVFAITVSPEGYLNVTEYVEPVAPPEIAGDYRVDIVPSVKVATRGDHVYYETTIIYIGKQVIFNVPIIDTLLLDNMLIDNADIKNITCSRLDNADNLFTSGMVIPRLYPGDIIKVSYYLYINDKIHENVTHNVLGVSNTVEIY